MSNFVGNNSLIAISKTPILTWDASGSPPLAGGDGTWNPSGGTNWVYGSTYGAWKNNAIALFNDPIPITQFITVNNGININGIIAELGGPNYSVTLFNSFTSTITLAGNNPIINVKNGILRTNSVYIAGSSGLTKMGGGTLIFGTLGNLGWYSGPTLINEGVLTVIGQNAQAISTNTNIVIANNAVFEFIALGNRTYPNTISGSGIIRRPTIGGQTSGIAIFTGNNSGFTGSWQWNGGSNYIAFVNDNAVGAPNVNISCSGASAGFYFTTTGNTLANTRTITLNGNCNLFWNGFSGNTNTIASLITGVGSITKQSYETHILTNNNTYTGSTNVRGVGSTAGAAEAVLRVSSGSLGGTAGQTGDFGNIVFQDNGTNGILEFVTAANLGICSQIRFRNTGGVAGYGGGLRYIGSTNETVDKTIQCDTGIGIRLESNSTGGGSITYNGTFSQTNRGLYLAGTGVGILNNVFSGTGSVNKRGSGSWTLGGNNTYSGGTNITAGTLKADVLNAFGTGTITISSNAVLDMNLLDLSNTIVNNSGSVINRPSNLLLHFDNNFNDSSANNLTVSAINGAVTSDTQSKFGGYSLFANGGYARIDNASSLVFGTNNFTVDSYIYMPVLNSGTGAHAIFSHRTADNSSSGILLCINPTSGNLYCFVANNSGGWQIVGQSLGHTITANTWHHVALVRNGNNLVAYLNGIAGSTVVISGAIGATGPFNIGCGSDKVNYSPIYGIQDFNGYIDEFRVINGKAIYTSNFTPQSLPF